MALFFYDSKSQYHFDKDRKDYSVNVIRRLLLDLYGSIDGLYSKLWQF